MADTVPPRDGERADLAWIARRGHHVAKLVEGLLVTLAAALTLDVSEDPGVALLALVGAIVAVWVAETYGEIIQREIQARRLPDWLAVRLLSFRNAGIPLAAIPAFIFLVLAWAGLISTTTATDLTIVFGTTFLGALGYAGARLAGGDQRSALTHAALLALIGVVVFVIKTLE